MASVEWLSRMDAAYGSLNVQTGESDDQWQVFSAATLNAGNSKSAAAMTRCRCMAPGGAMVACQGDRVTTEGWRRRQPLGGSTVATGPGWRNGMHGLCARRTCLSGHGRSDFQQG